MKNLFKFIFSFFLLGGLLLQSCKSKQVPGEYKERITHKTEIVKDTVLIVQKDSSYYSAYIDCVNGKPVLVQSQKQINDYNSKNPANPATAPKSRSGRSLKPPVINLQDGILQVDCQKEAENLFFTWKETFVKEWEVTHKPLPPVEKELTTFQKVKLFIGNVIFWALGAAIVAFLIRFLISKKLF